jgi:hypothetical protein
MSALPPKADICAAQAHVRFGPTADIAQGPAALDASRSGKFDLPHGTD